MIISDLSILEVVEANELVGGEDRKYSRVYGSEVRINGNLAIATAAAFGNNTFTDTSTVTTPNSSFSSSISATGGRGRYGY